MPPVHDQEGMRGPSHAHRREDPGNIAVLADMDPPAFEREVPSQSSLGPVSLSSLARSLLPCARGLTRKRRGACRRQGEQGRREGGGRRAEARRPASGGEEGDTAKRGEASSAFLVFSTLSGDHVAEDAFFPFSPFLLFDCGRYFLQTRARIQQTGASASHSTLTPRCPPSTPLINNK